MKPDDYWHSFLNSGSIFDYIEYCKHQHVNDITSSEASSNVVHNQRDNNQRTEYR